MEDRQYMAQALALAEKGVGWVSPNPMVGAVVVKNGQVIGRGWHQKCGQAHAERNALADCRESPQGAVLYVTLEPCCHQGRQPPCTQAILEAGIRRVVVGCADPNPLVAGKGVALLRAHGIEVTQGVLEEQCQKLNQVFFHYITTGRPIPGIPGGSPGRRPGPTSTPSATATGPSWRGWARCWPTIPCSPAGWRGDGTPCG